MNKDVKILLGVACVAGGLFMIHKGLNEPKPTMAEVKATRGGAMTFTAPGLAVTGFGLYLIFKKA